MGRDRKEKEGGEVERGARRGEEDEREKRRREIKRHTHRDGCNISKLFVHPFGPHAITKFKRR